MPTRRVSLCIAPIVILGLCSFRNASAQTTVFSTDYGAGPSVHSVGRDGSNPQTLFPPNSLTYSIYGPWLSNVAVDTVNSKIYWTEQYGGGNLGRIERADLDGGNRETVVPVGSYLPSDIVLDPEHEYVYWNSAQLGIQRQNYDGTDQQTIVNASLCERRGMAAYLRGNALFWIGPTELGIMRADMDGSNPVTIVATPDAFTYGLAVDPVGQRLYWSRLDGTISSAWLDGSDVQSVLSGLSVPTAIAIDAEERKIYWAGGGLWRANLDGTGIEFIYSFGPTLAIALDNDSVAPAVPAANAWTLVFSAGFTLFCGAWGAKRSHPKAVRVTALE